MMELEPADDISPVFLFRGRYFLAQGAEVYEMTADGLKLLRFEAPLPPSGVIFYQQRLYAINPSEEEKK